MEIPTLLLSATRLLAYLCTLVLAGCALAAWPLGGGLGDAGARLRRRAVRVAMGAGALLTLCRLALLYGQTWLFFAEFEGVNAETLTTVAVDTSWGAGWRIQFGAATFALLGALAGATIGSPGVPVLLVGSLAAAASMALTGHAVAEGWMSPALLSQSVHAVAVATWIGSLAMLYLLVVRDTDARAIRAVVERFSPLALVSAATLAATGLATSWLYLSTPADLLTTTYGRLLLLKVAGFAGVATFGYHNWQRVKPRLGAPEATADLRRSVGRELGLAVLVLAVTAVLVATSLPAAGH